MTTSRSAKAFSVMLVLRRASAAAASAGVMRPISTRPSKLLVILPTPFSSAAAALSISRAGMPRRTCARGDARTHDAGAEDADLIDRLRLHGRIADAVVLLQALGHEEHGDQIARDGTADQLDELIRLDFQPVLQRQIAALGDGVERRQRRGVLPAGLGQHLRASDGERERLLLLAQSDRLLFALAGRFPLVRLLLRHWISRTASSCRRSAGTASKTRPICRARSALAASPAQIISAASDGPMSRVKRCVPPQPGMRPIFVSGRPISVFGCVLASR